MDINLNGKIALVTGSTPSTSGIGYAIAQGLAKAGAAVVINGRSAERVELTVQQLRSDIQAARVNGIAADVGNIDGIRQVLEAVPHTDILINNAGLPKPKPFFDITDADWEQQFQVHVMAAVRLSRHYAQGMVNTGWGRILFNASTTGGFISGEQVHYGTTKTALLGLARGLAESLAGTGVTVNSFLPGPTRTRTEQSLPEAIRQTSDTTFAAWEQQVFDSLSTSLIKRFIEPEEVANLVVFLASEQASAITGAAVRVDGGIVRSIL